MTLTLVAATDVGLRREHNEDRFAMWTPDDPLLAECRGTLLVVADGMGGSAAGEIASQLAVDTVVASYRTCDDDPSDVALRRAVERAHAAVRARSQATPSLSGMGTTCTAVAVRGHDLAIAHVGDSRAYLIRSGLGRQLTSDHSLVAQLVAHRLLTPDQARSDPRRNVLTRSVGIGEQLQVDGGPVPGGLETGDTLMLCSDGLHGLVADDELARLGARRDLQAACDELVALARSRGGPDNITVMLARVEP